MDHEYLELRNTDCKKDYRKTHCWDKIGFDNNNDGYFVVYQCSQCRKIIMEKVEKL